MGRPSKFDVDGVMDAALRVLERDGMRALSATRVCEELGAPSGSLYHRFASRDALAIELWLRSAERFQNGFRQALESQADPLDAALAAARFIVERARNQRAEAVVLMAYRREDLIRGPWPTKVREKARDLEQSYREMITSFAERLWPEGGADVERMNFALISIPLAAATGELRGTIHPATDSMKWVETALKALLADRWSLHRKCSAPIAD